MTIDSSIIDELADPEKSQWFLTSPTKIRALVDAAEIRPGDRVVEVGAGIGTITSLLPSDAQVTSIELDEHIGAHLVQLAPDHIDVIIGDGLNHIEAHPFDVLISSIPTELAEEVIRNRLPKLSWRTAIVAIEPDTALDDLRLLYKNGEVVTTAEGDDYQPCQPCVSRFIRLDQQQSGR